MAEDTTALRQPETTWDYAMSAADSLTRWRARELPAVGRDPLRTDVVVLIGASLYARTRSALLDGPAVKDASLAYVRHLLLNARDWISDCPPPPGMGRDEMNVLLIEFERFEIARYAAQDVLEAHLRAAADPAVTVAGRAAAMRADQ
ncbi:hypothetical protein [Streptomyces sp. NPDC091217]|uniref:hypothetical protein n=1 Tax=Streptomyces sp. NPDC091217 TaxID=3365975 RepID=UPI0037F5CAE1